MAKLVRYFRVVFPIVVVLSLIATACSGSTTTSGQPSSEKKWKVAILLNYNRDDHGHNAAAYPGTKALEGKLPVEVTIADGQDPSRAESSMREFASKGYNVVIGHSYDWNEPVKRIAKEFPNTFFIISGGDQSAAVAPNIALPNIGIEESGYLSGVLAALTTKTKKVAYLGAFEFPTLKDELVAYKAGVQSVDPKIEILEGWVGTWVDVAKTKEAGIAMNAKGADVIAAMVNGASPGLIEAAKEKKFFYIGYGVDQNEQAPSQILSSALAQFGNVYEALIRSAMDGKFKSGVTRWGIKDKGTDLAPLKNVSDDVKKKVEQTRQDIIDGKIKVPRFTQ